MGNKTSHVFSKKHLLLDSPTHALSARRGAFLSSAIITHGQRWPIALCPRITSRIRRPPYGRHGWVGSPATSKTGGKYEHVETRDGTFLGFLCFALLGIKREKHATFKMRTCDERRMTHTDMIPWLPKSGNAKKDHVVVINVSWQHVCRAPVWSYPVVWVWHKSLVVLLYNESQRFKESFSSSYSCFSSDACNTQIGRKVHFCIFGMRVLLRVVAIALLWSCK